MFTLCSPTSFIRIETTTSTPPTDGSLPPTTPGLVPLGTRYDTPVLYDLKTWLNVWVLDRNCELVSSNSDLHTAYRFPSSSWSCQCPCGCGTVVKRYNIISITRKVDTKMFTNTTYIDGFLALPIGLGTFLLELVSFDELASTHETGNDYHTCRLIDTDDHNDQYLVTSASFFKTK